MPANQLTEEHWAKEYAGIEANVYDVEERKAAAHREARLRYRSATAIVFLMVVFPLIFELIAMGWSFLGTAMGVISFGIGLYKGGKRLGWIKESKLEREEVEKEQKMRHYYYHCERNPEAFARLKIENFNRENIEKNKQKFEKLHGPRP